MTWSCYVSLPLRDHLSAAAKMFIKREMKGRVTSATELFEIESSSISAQFVNT